MPQANSLNYVSALEEAGVPVHTLPLNVANHGYGFKTDFAYHAQIVSDLTAWLQELSDVLTAVDAPTLHAHPESAPVYNLSGQRVSHPHHGIYVTGDKKVVVR